MFSLALYKKYHFKIFLFVLLFLSVFLTIVYDDIRLDAGDDYYFHMERFEALIQSFKDGTFPLYINYKAVYGYGYLIEPFYSDFILIPYGIIGTLTGNAFAYQFLLLTMTVLCGSFMYQFIYKLSDSSFAASISSLLYTFSMYRIFDMYCRAALGEVLALTFFPLVFLGLYYVINGDLRKWYILPIGFSLIIMSHVISTVLLFIMVIILSLFYCKCFIREPKRLYYLILSGLITVFISSYYLLPFLEQLLSDTFYFQKYKFDTAFINTLRLGVGEIIKSMADGLVHRLVPGPKLGFLLVFPLFARLFVKKNDENKDLLRYLDLFFVLGTLCLISASPIVSWAKFPFIYLQFIQFPSRFFLFVTFFFAVSAGCYLQLALRNNTQKMIIYFFVFIFSGVAVWQSVDIYEKRSHYMGRFSEEGRYQDEYEHLFFSGMEYFPVKLSPKDSLRHFIVTRSDSVISQPGATIVAGFARNKYITQFDVDVSKKDSLELPLVYYKGYSATLNGKEIPVTESSHGLVQIPIDQSGRVEAWYKGTLIQKLSFYTTILSIFALCAYIFLQNRKKKHLKN